MFNETLKELRKQVAAIREAMNTYAVDGPNYTTASHIQVPHIVSNGINLGYQSYDSLTALLKDQSQCLSTLTKISKNESITFEEHQILTKHAAFFENETIKNYSKIHNPNKQKALYNYIYGQLQRSTLDKDSNKYKEFKSLFDNTDFQKSINVSDLESKISEVRKIASKHRDEGIVGFFKATWARNPESLNQLNEVFNLNNTLRK